MRTAMAAMLLLLGCGDAALASSSVKTPPYWASISAGEARMRSGPGRNYPVSWLYRRADLPVRVIEVHLNWRKVQDPDGEKGWLLVNLLSDRRTAYVKTADAAIRQSPDRGARMLWKAAPGVIGRIDKCERGWCEIEIGDREGYVEVGDVWGVDLGEEVR